MKVAFYVSMILSSVSFMWYGIAGLVGDGMIDDFARFGLTRYRRLTGGLEVLGGVGLLAGLLWTPLLTLSAAGLSVLMLAGVIVRLRVRDAWLETVPALVLLLLNVFLTGYSLSVMEPA